MTFLRKPKRKSWLNPKRNFREKSIRHFRRLLQYFLLEYLLICLLGFLRIFLLGFLQGFLLRIFKGVFLKFFQKFLHLKKSFRISAQARAKKKNIRIGRESNKNYKIYIKMLTYFTACQKLYTGSSMFAWRTSNIKNLADANPVRGSNLK